LFAVQGTSGTNAQVLRLNNRVEDNYSTSLGTGTPIFTSRGSWNEYNTLAASAGLTITSNNNVLTWSLTGGSPPLSIITNGVSAGTTTNLEFAVGTGMTVTSVVVANTNKVTHGLNTTLQNLSGTGAVTNANANQFVITTGVLSHKDNALMTNVQAYGSTKLVAVTGGDDLDFGLRIYSTNTVSWTQFGVVDQVRSTNNVQLSIGSNTVAAGQVLKVHSTAISGGINDIVITNDTTGGGGGSPPLNTITNGVQMGVTTNLEFIAGNAITIGGNVVANTNTITITATRVGVYRTIYVDAGGMVPNATFGAQFATDEAFAPTNRMIDSFIFANAVTNVTQFKLALPMEWDLGTVKLKLFYWSTNASATATNVWAIDATAVSHDDQLSADWGTAQTITHKITVADDLQLTAATAALTIGGTPAAQDLVWVRVRRLGAHADDNETGQSKLLGAWLQYKESTTEPAIW
jgi:hypothetical protein